MSSRIEQFKKLFKEDHRALSLIEGVEKSISRLTEAVRNLVRIPQVQQHRLEEPELIALTRRLAEVEHTAHTGLVDSVIALNRYLFRTYGTENVPAGGVVEADPFALKSDFRGTVKDWAFSMVH